MAAQFDIKRIEAALHGFQQEFDAINARLSLHRERLDDAMLGNMLAAYRFLNTLMQSGVDLFSEAGLHSLAEINHIVLCGTDPAVRREYYRHIVETRSRFNKLVRPVRKWVNKHRNDADPVALASGFYLRMLSRPQLFIEGNHRSGNIVLNYLLVGRGHAPLVVTRDNAFEYLEVSGEIKFTERETVGRGPFKLAGYRREFSRVVRRYASAEFLAEKGAYRVPVAVS